MPKPRKSINARIPAYAPPRLEWRRKIQAVVSEALRKAGVVYSQTDHLEVRLKLYFEGSAVRLHDLDNRIKDILDALRAVSVVPSV